MLTSHSCKGQSLPLLTVHGLVAHLTWGYALPGRRVIPGLSTSEEANPAEDVNHPNFRALVVIVNRLNQKDQASPKPVSFSASPESIWHPVHQGRNDGLPEPTRSLGRLDKRSSATGDLITIPFDCSDNLVAVGTNAEMHVVICERNTEEIS